MAAPILRAPSAHSSRNPPRSSPSRGAPCAGSPSAMRQWRATCRMLTPALPGGIHCTRPWLNVAGSAAPRDAWEAFKAGNAAV